MCPYSVGIIWRPSSSGRSQFTDIFYETAQPIKAKPYMEHPLEAPGHITKMAAITVVEC